MGADSKPIQQEQIAEDGVIRDGIQQEFIDLVPYIETAEGAIISFAKNASAYLKGVNLDSLDLEGLEELETRLQGVNTVTEESVKLDKLKAQSAQAAANAEKAQTQAAAAKLKLDEQLNAAQQKKIVLTKEEIAQKQINAQKDREAIALIKAQLTAQNESVGTIQRIQAANVALRAEQKNLNITTAEGAQRHAEINKQLDLNNATIKNNADQLKKQALNVGNYSESFTHSMRPMTELIRGLGYAMGIPIEGLREYAGVIRGATELSKGHKEATEAESIALDTQGNVIEKSVEEKEAETAATLESTAASEASIPIIGWVIAGTVALAAITATVIELTEEHAKALAKRSEAMDDSVIYDEKVRKGYNDDILLMDELMDKYKMLTGAITESQAAEDKITNQLKRDLKDISNETAKNVHDAYSFWKSFLEFSTQGVYGGQRAANMNAQNEGDAERYKKQLEAQNALFDLYKSNYDKLLAANQSYDQTLIENQENLSKAKNAFIRNDFEKEQANTRASIIASKEKLKNDLFYWDTAHKADADYLTKRNEMIAKEANFELVTQQETNLRLQENARQHIATMLGLLQEQASLTNDKAATANATYDVQRNTLHNSQEYLQGTKAEKNLADENLERQHEAALLAIKRETEDKWAEIDKQGNALILNRYDRERAVAQQTYDDQLRSYKRMLDDQLKSKDEAVRKEAQAQYDTKTGLATTQLNQANANINEEQRVQNNATNDDINVQSAKNQTAKDVNSYANITKLWVDKKNELAAEYSKNVDALDAADAKAMKDGEMTEEQHLERLHNLTEQYNNDQDAADKEHRDKQIDEMVKYQETLTNSLAEGLQKRADMQQASDQENIDTHARLMQSQESLAAGGRANSLATETAETEKAEEKKLQDAKRAQKAQEAIQLANILLELTAAYAKAGNVNNPEFKALTTTLAAKGLAAAIAGYAKGVEGIDGPGTTVSDSILARLSKGESVATADATSATPGLITAINKDGYNGAVDWANVNIPQFKAANSTAYVSSAYNSDISSKLVPEIRELKRAVESRPVQNVSLGRLAEWTEEIRNEQSIIRINHLKKSGRSRL